MALAVGLRLTTSAEAGMLRIGFIAIFMISSPPAAYSAELVGRSWFVGAESKTVLAEKVSFDAFKAQRSALEESGISELGIQRTACFGRCPEFSFKIQRDGRFQYYGAKNVGRLGHITGTVDVKIDFLRVAQQIESLGYFQMKDDYSVPLTDLPSVFSYADKNGLQKVVRNYGECGPVNLWNIETLVEAT